MKELGIAIGALDYRSDVGAGYLLQQPALDAVGPNKMNGELDDITIQPYSPVFSLDKSLAGRLSGITSKKLQEIHIGVVGNHRYDLLESKILRTLAREVYVKRQMGR